MMPVNPKLLLESSLDFGFLDDERTDETPIPIAMMKGTVIGPVVAPPESKAMPMNGEGAKNVSAKRIEYSTNSRIFTGKLSMVRRSPAIRKKPTPAAMSTTM